MKSAANPLLRIKAEFLVRGRRSLEATANNGEYFDAAEVMQRLRVKLAAARSKPRTPGR